ncbi:hypothetical protein EDD86DRAFT_48175 [Gorgonomyces haynaldii]|nr:hypothetical protein EDD86DRAFT_48175 [Gorgonomyces haynaldii]
MLYIIWPYQRLTKDEDVIFSFAMNFTTSILMPLTICFEMEYLKMVYVIGYLQPQAIFKIQCVTIIFGVVSLGIASVADPIIYFTSSSRLEASIWFQPYLNVAVSVFTIGLCAIEVIRLTYTFVVFRRFIKQRQTASAIESYAFVSYILIACLIVDVFSAFLVVGFKLPVHGNAVIVSMHLSFSFLMIHFLNRLVLSKKPKKVQLAPEPVEMPPTRIVQHVNTAVDFDTQMME